MDSLFAQVAEEKFYLKGGELAFIVMGQESMIAQNAKIRRNFDEKKN